MLSMKNGARMFGFILALSLAGSSVAAPPDPVYLKQPMHPFLQELLNYAKKNHDYGSLPKHTIIAHRGLFQVPDVRSAKGWTKSVLPENSLESVRRAKSFGIKAVELDVRSSKDGVPFVIHDLATNRNTEFDNDRGKYNAHVLFREKEDGWNVSIPSSIYIKETNSAVLDQGWHLKAYTANEGMGVSEHETLVTLRKFLDTILTWENTEKAHYPLVILDVSDPVSAKASAEVVQLLGMQDRVILKFFATKAVVNYASETVDTAAAHLISYWGADLHYIIQINSGEFTNVDGFGIFDRFAQSHTLPLGAQPYRYVRAFLNTGRVIGVGITKPANSVKGDGNWYASNGSEMLFNQIRASTEKTPQGRLIKNFPIVGVWTNADSSWIKPAGGNYTRPTCKLYRFNVAVDVDSKKSINPINYGLESQRREFAARMPYVIADILPLYKKNNKHSYSAEINDFVNTLCLGFEYRP